MNVHITARHTDLSPEAEAYCRRRLAALTKVFAGVTDVDVIVGHARNRFTAEIHVRAKGTGIVVAEESHDLMNSLNLAFDDLDRKIKKEREKFRDKKRRGGRVRKEIGLPEAAATEPVPQERRIVRAPAGPAKPMTLEEAALEIDLKKRDILVFRQPGTEKWTVLFRRKDGNLGLVEPE
jgi:putative sigma-54 modulation protein